MTLCSPECWGARLRYWDQDPSGLHARQALSPLDSLSSPRSSPAHSALLAVIPKGLRCSETQWDTLLPNTSLSHSSTGQVTDLLPCGPLCHSFWCPVCTAGLLASRLNVASVTGLALLSLKPLLSFSILSRFLK